MKSVVLDGFAVNPGDLNWDFLGKFGEYTVYDKASEEESAELAKDADIVLSNRVKIGKALLDKCPNIKFVSPLGTGYDIIDVAECRKRGIEVCNAPDYSTPSVAQLAFTLLLALTTDLDAFKGVVKRGSWTGEPGFAYQTIPFLELQGKTVGIYGCGAIGKCFASICSGFGMKVIAYRRSFAPGMHDGIEYVDRPTLLENSDFLSLHCPLTPETRDMVNAEFISQMKKGAYLINTSRGAVICEDDLANALNSGYLSGAGIDVMRKEPPSPDNPLLTAKNCIITPHCAWVTRAARERLLKVIESNIASFIEKGVGINRVF